jgi:hypothetical protein
MAVTLNERGIEELFRDPEGPVGDIMERAALAVETTAKRSLMHMGDYHEYLPGHYLLHKAGRWYAWDRDAPPHASSRPLSPPSSDTGVLAASIGHQVFVGDEYVEASVGSPLDYAFYVELGTRLMDARPFLRPALDVLGHITFVMPDAETEPPGRLFFTPIEER